MNSNDFLKEGIGEDAHAMALDHEVQMARQECYHAAEDAIALHKLLRHMSEQQGLEGWVSAKITLASDYLNTVREHLEYQLMAGAEQQEPISVVTVAEGIITQEDLAPVTEGPVTKKPQPYNDPNWAKNLPKEKLDALAGTRYKKDKKDKDVAEGTVYDLEKEYGYEKPRSQPRRFAPSDYPYSQEEDDAYFREIFRKKRLAAQKAEREADHERLATGTNEGEEMGTFAALKDWQVWDVHVFNNYYRGKYADYGPRLYSVVAGSPEQARQVVIDNADYVLQDLLSRKLQNGKKVLPRGSALPIEEKRVGKATPGSITTVGLKKMLTPDGVQSYKFSNGKIVDGGERGTMGLNASLEQHADDKMKELGHKFKGVAEGAGKIADNKQSKLDALENKLEAKGYTRVKDSNGGEYQYKWIKDGAPTYVVNYRFGSNGYAEFWKEQGVAEDEAKLKAYKRASAGDAINRQNIARHTGKADPKIAKRNAGQERAEKRLSSISQGISETSAGSVAGVVAPVGKNKAKVGSLFGGTYKQKKAAK